MDLPLSEDGQAEMVKDSVRIYATQAKENESIPHNEDSTLFMIDNFNRCDTPAKAIRKVKVMLKCKTVWKSRILETKLNYADCSPTIQQCRNVLLRVCQRYDMTAIISKMSAGLSYEETVKTLPVKDRKVWMNMLKKFVPYLDEDHVLLVGGRLQESTLDFNQKHPAFLPLKNCITFLFVRAQHFLSAHSGPHHVLGELIRVFGVFPVGEWGQYGKLLGIVSTVS